MCSIYHFNALLGNTTTIERWEKDKAAIMVRRGKISEVCRWDFLLKLFLSTQFSGQISLCGYLLHCLQVLFSFSSKDLGRRRNIESVLGKNFLLWCFSTRPTGSGLKYELSSRDGEWSRLSTINQA